MDLTSKDVIAVCARSQTREFMVALCSSIKRKFNSKIFLYCEGAQEVSYYARVNSDLNVFAEVIDARKILSSVFDQGLCFDEVVSRARVFEELTGKTINSMMVPDRHLGRGYAIGGFFHPRSRYSEETNYLQALHAYCTALEFWRAEFIEKEISLVINGSREAFHIAEFLRVPYRALARSRIKNLHFWAWTPMYESPLFEMEYHSIGESDDEPISEPYHAHLANRKRYIDGFSAKRFLSNSCLTLLRFVYWRLRGYEKGKGYYLRENLLYHFRVWREYKRLLSLSLKKLDDLAGKRFVYFPLHVEPETALHGLSPEFFSQHSLIASVSRDLPAGVYLAVKEPYGMIGRRNANFYRHILDLKNVILLDPWEIGLQCAQRADAVVTICGTAGLEAVSSGTPVISFGRHNIYNFLPCVHVVSDEVDLKDYLKIVLADDLDKAEVRAQGARLIEAIKRHSFDMEEYDYLNIDEFSDGAVSGALVSLEASLSAL